jgi:hypothetical protein
MKQTERKATQPNTGSNVEIDENQLELDPVYRFKYVCEVVGLSEEDHATLRRHQEVIEPHLSSIAERVYQKMFSFDSMKRHFLPRHTEFDGEVAASLDEVTLQSDQTQFRTQRLTQYFGKLCTADWDDTFAILIDIVGSMHTKKHGNSALEVPPVQVVALLGAINDFFLETISELDLSGKSRIAIQRAYTKLFWVQNCMFIRHWV